MQNDTVFRSLAAIQTYILSLREIEDALRAEQEELNEKLQNAREYADELRQENEELHRELQTHKLQAEMSEQENIELQNRASTLEAELENRRSIDALKERLSGDGALETLMEELYSSVDVYDKTHPETLDDKTRQILQKISQLSDN